MSEHEVTELAVFREFALVCPLNIESESIEKRQPPEPDIFCRAETGPVAFEMVELVDRDRIARPTGDQSELMDSLRDARNKLPEETRLAFANAWVGVKFRSQSLRKRKTVAEQVVVELTRKDTAFEGEFGWSERETEVALVEVKRREGLAGGPHFRVVTVGWFEPIPLDALAKKFGNKYQSNAPIELLAYYDRQHAPLAEQLSELIQFVAVISPSRHLDAFGFSTVSIAASAIRICKIHYLDSKCPTAEAQPPELRVSRR